MIHIRPSRLASVLLLGLLPGCEQGTAPSSNTDASTPPAAAANSAPATGSGAKIPLLTAGTWFNVPAGKTTIEQKDLDGKIVFVEFWATW